MLQIIFYFLSSLLGFYSLIIFIRIILGWFSGASLGRSYEYLCKITDPYLFLFRRMRFFNTGSVDLSPIIALALLSISGSILVKLAESGHITIGFVLSLLLSIICSAGSFIIGFYVIILIIRLVAYFMNADIYSPFWRIIDYISRPAIYRITRIIFRNRIVHYLTNIVTSIIALIVLYISFNIVMNIGIKFFSGLLI